MSNTIRVIRAIVNAMPFFAAAFFVCIAVWFTLEGESWRETGWIIIAALWAWAAGCANRQSKKKADRDE